MDENGDQLLTSDVMILLAVLESTYAGGINVRGILSHVDYMDHNVLSEDDLVGGLHRLSGWGFISAHDGLFRAQMKFAREYRLRAEKSKSNREKFDIVKALIEERLGAGAGGGHAPAGEIVTSGEYWHALNDYLSGGDKE